MKNVTFFIFVSKQLVLFWFFQNGTYFLWYPTLFFKRNNQYWFKLIRYIDIIQIQICKK